MKKIRSLCGIFLVVTILFTSCSTEDDPWTLEEEKAYLSFNTFLVDSSLKLQDKQKNYETSNCTSEIPVYIEIILNSKNSYVAGSKTLPLRLKLSTNTLQATAGGVPSYFTEASNALELAPGTYTLEYFTVLDSAGNILWITPVNINRSGEFDEFAGQSLPMEITLGAGVKKYQDVEAICFDNRDLDDYGTLFNEINGIRIIEFCIFGNQCYASGRHEDFMLFKVDVWKYSGDTWAPKGILLHEDLQNEVVVIDYEDYSEINSFPLCFTLPDGPGLDEYFIEITQVNMGGENVLIRSGLITDGDVRDLFRENDSMEYFHFTEGECNINDNPVLLGDPRDIIGFTWEFTFVFGDALLAADVVFYPDGTASFQLYGDPEDTVWGTWAYFNDTLYYQPDGDEDILGFGNVSGKLRDEGLSGTFWYYGYQDEWFAFKKD